MKSEIGLQLLQQPINEPVFLDRGSVIGDQPLRFFDVAVQTVEIGEQENVGSAAHTAIFFALQQADRSIEVPLCQRPCDQVRHRLERRRCRTLRHSFGNRNTKGIGPQYLQDRDSQTGVAQVEVELSQLVASNCVGEISRLAEDKE